MYSARRVVVQRSARMLQQQQQRRSAQTIPRSGTEAEMKTEALEQIKARLAYQKELIREKGGHSHEEEVDEMWKWIRISFLVAFPICVLSSIKDVLFGSHHHLPEGPQPEYMKIRTKAFPWECEDCELFNTACWKQCRAEK